jgi:hypothetical protein
MTDSARRRDNLNNFWSCQVWQRRGELVSFRRGLFAVVLGLAAALLIPQISNEQALVSNLAATALTFASISFGACLTGAVLALTVPSKDQREHWSQSGLPGRPFSHFSDLMFVFTWPAMSQLAVVGASVGIYLAEARPTTISAQHVGLPLHIFLGILGVVGINAVLQLTAVVKTISQLAVVGATPQSGSDDRA